MTRPVFELAVTARPEHIDELGHVNNAVWVQWIQEVALAHWYSVADPAHQDDYIWVVVRHEIDYLRAVFEGETSPGAPGSARRPRARGSTGTWNSSATTARSGSAPSPNGRSSTRPAGRPIRVPPEVVAPFMEQR